LANLDATTTDTAPTSRNDSITRSSTEEATTREPARRPGITETGSLSLEEHHALLDTTRDAVVVHDLEGRIVFWNRAAEQIYGWTRAEAIGRHLAEHLYVDPKKFQETSRITLEKGEWSGDLRQLSKDRRELVVESKWSVLREKDGRPKSVLGVKTDVTEKRQIEMQFIRAQRMASLGRGHRIARDPDAALAVGEPGREERHRRIDQIGARSIEVAHVLAPARLAGCGHARRSHVKLTAVDHLVM